MKRILKILIPCVIGLTCQSQTWQWGKRGGSTDQLDTNGTHRKEEVYSIASDSNKNIYTLSSVGLNNLNIDGNPKSNFGDSTTKTDIALSSFGCDGNYRWSKIIGGVGFEQVHSIQTDDQDNVYIAGKFGGCQNATFPPRIDSDVIITQSPQDCSAIFIAKYNSDGILQWFKRPQLSNVSLTVGYAQTYSRGLSIDGLGNTYWLVAIPPGTYADGAFTNTLTGSNWYIFKYDADGNFLTASLLDMQMAGGQGGLFTELYRNPYNGNFYVTGQRQDTYPVTIGGQDVIHSTYFASFNNAGNFLWLKENSSTTVFGGVIIYSIAFDPDSSIYISTRFIGSNADSFMGVSIPEPIATSLIMKIDSNAENVIWSTYYNHNGAENSSITLNGNEIGFAGLCFSSNFTWGTQSIFASNTNEGTEVLLARFNKNDGECISLVKIPGDVGYADSGTALTADASGDYILGGGFGHHLMINGNTLVNAGSQSDFFVAKYATESCSPLAIEDHSLNGIEIFPNPADDTLIVTLSEPLKYSIFNLTGNLVGEGEVSNDHSNINIQNLSTGAYLLKLESGNGESKTVKFLKK